MTNEKPLIIASRGSQLALWQAHHVQSLFAARNALAEIKIVKTKGDRIQDRFLHEIGGKGVFVREIEDVLSRGEADVAVHSLKDLPAVLPEGFELPAVLKRHSHRDLMIFAPKWQHLNNDKPLGKADIADLGEVTIATGSLRRSCLLKQSNPQLSVEGLRGNVDTRLRKLQEGHWDAIVLAEASLERLGWMGKYPCRPLDPDWFIPSPAQGALALETRAYSAQKSLIENWDCRATHFAVDCERGLLSRLGGDCTMPIGVYVRQVDGDWVGDAVVLDHNGGMAKARVQMSHSAQVELVVEQMLNGLVEASVDDVLSNLGLKRP